MNSKETYRGKSTSVTKEFAWLFVLLLCGGMVTPSTRAELTPSEPSLDPEVLQGYRGYTNLMIEITDDPPAPLTELNSIPAEIESITRGRHVVCTKECAGAFGHRGNGCGTIGGGYLGMSEEKHCMDIRETERALCLATCK